MKIGEIISGSVLDGLVAKLQLDNPEDLRIGYPVVVEGQKYDFYCMVHDILNKEMDIAERLAGSDVRDAIIPTSVTHEGYGGKIFYSMAKLRPIQLIDKEGGDLSEPQTIPPYFSEARHATKEDVELIYQVREKSAPLGTIRGVEPFYVHMDFGKLAEKPFAIFGRTGMGKSILNKLVCCAILAKDVASVLIFDMHGEYGVYSKTDNTEGLKFYFPGKVEVFSLDAKNREARPFVLDPAYITPDDIIIAFQDLTGNMIDAVYAIDRSRSKDVDLVTAIRSMDPLTVDESIVHPSVLQGLQRRMERFRRFDFVRSGGRDAFNQLIQLIKNGKSVVMDFGDYGTDPMTYFFVANVLSRRLFETYTEKNEEYPRLVVFLEEAHKFLDPRVANYTIFSRLARETRKFNLILALIDQRPSRIDDEVRSQLANRLVMSLKEPSDVSAALAGVPDRAMWENIIATIPARTVAVIGDAIRIPTVVDIMHYKDLEVREHIIGYEAYSEDKLEALAKRADGVFGT